MRWLGLLITMMVLSINELHAQDEFEHVEVLDHPRYSLTGKLVLDLDLQILPLDGYIKPMMVDAALSYQFNDFFVIEPVRFGYSFYNHDTGLKKSIETEVQNKTGSKNFGLADSTLKDMRYSLGGAAFVNILYSKSNLFNTGVVYHYWQVGGGVTYYDMDEKSQVGLDLAMRLRFFLNERTTFNVRGGHTIGFKTGAPDNITYLSLGVGFGF